MNGGLGIKHGKIIQGVLSPKPKLGDQPHAGGI